VSLTLNPLAARPRLARRMETVVGAFAIQPGGLPPTGWQPSGLNFFAREHFGGIACGMILERVDVHDCEDRLQVGLHRGRYDFVLARLTPGQRVLEVGTGAGTFTQELVAKCGSYVGVEYDADSCLEARKKTGGTAAIVRADARALPLADNQFSFIICLEVLEHLGDFAAGVRNIHRSIRPDGTAVISVPYRRKGGKSDINPYHLYEPGEQELVSSFRQHFEQVEVYYQYFRETPWMTLARRLRVRRLFGLARIYAELTAGAPRAMERVHIDRDGPGWRITLMLVVRKKK